MESEKPEAPENISDRAGATPMARTYVKVMMVEVVIIVLLWVLGKMY